jgi:hypothetical protein
MKPKIKYSSIRSLSDLEWAKKSLNKHLRLRKRLLDIHLKNLNEDFSGEYVYKQTLKALKVENGLWGLAPTLLKKAGVEKKGFLVTLFSSLGAAITSFFFFKNKKATKSAAYNNTDKSSSNNSEQWFI